jgi:hypothetical protein
MRTRATLSRRSAITGLLAALCMPSLTPAAAATIEGATFSWGSVVLRIGPHTFRGITAIDYASDRAIDDTTL